MKTRGSKIKAALALLLAGFLVAALPAPASGPDPDFGDGGRVDLSAPPLSVRTGIADMVATSQWIYLLGDPGLTVTRIDTQGAPDQGFGRDGWALISRYEPSITGNSRYAYALSIQPDGKIVLAGAYESTPLLSRLNPDGSFDETFGDGGLVLYPTPYPWRYQDGWLSDIEVDAKGRILVAGGRPGPERGVYWAFVRRHLPDGRIDRSFAKRGTALFKGPRKQGVDFYALELTRGGRILVVRNDPARDSAVFALTPSGRVDQRFANRKGALSVPAGYRLDTDDSGRITAFGLSFRRLSGKAGRGCVRFFAFNWAGVRSKAFSKDGFKEICQLDLKAAFPSFDIDSEGIFRADFGVQGDGRVVAALAFSAFRPGGVKPDPARLNQATFRLERDGSFDRSFGADGLFRSWGDPVVEGLPGGVLVAGGEMLDPREGGYPVLYRFTG